jgi:hypothetical protein
MRENQTTTNSGKRVAFAPALPIHIMAIDGTWRRDGNLVDVSETDAEITMQASVEGLASSEFFLLLSSVGMGYRRCRLAWVNGDHLGLVFVGRQGFNKCSAPVLA